MPKEHHLWKIIHTILFREKGILEAHMLKYAQRSRIVLFNQSKSIIYEEIVESP